MMICGDVQKFHDSNNLNIEQHELIFSEDISKIAAWAAIICSVLGCVGNLFTILVLLCKASFRIHSTTPFLLSLALSDLLFSSINLPVTAARYFKRSWPLG